MFLLNLYNKKNCDIDNVTIKRNYEVKTGGESVGKEQEIIRGWYEVVFVCRLCFIEKPLWKNGLSITISVSVLHRTNNGTANAAILQFIVVIYIAINTDGLRAIWYNVNITLDINELLNRRFVNFVMTGFQIELEEFWEQNEFTELLTMDIEDILINDS